MENEAGIRCEAGLCLGGLCLQPCGGARMWLFSLEVLGVEQRPVSFCVPVLPQ